jgi:hypothetical protein
MAATHKSTVMARQMAEDLKLRTGLAITTGLDASANPTILVGAGTAGSQSAFIRIKQQDVIFPDPIFGVTTQRAYTPHVTQIVVETSGTANVPLLTGANFAKILTDVLKFGTKVELYMSANTNAPDVADITSSNLKTTIDALYHPLTETM